MKRCLPLLLELDFDPRLARDLQGLHEERRQFPSCRKARKLLCILLGEMGERISGAEGWI